MKVPLSWLRDFAPFDLDPRDLGETFDDLGMVVEGIEFIGQGVEHVVVARVLDVAPHPNADRVRVTQVDAGDGALQVVCGAPNVAAGQLVAFAPVGAELPGDFTIGRRQVRGVWSEGMICSARELGLGEDAAGIMVLDGDPEPGSPLAAALGLETDVVYDLAIEGNRPDANCIAGVARDAAARLRLPFAIPEPAVAESGAKVEELATIAVDCPDLCPRFTARVVTGVSVGPSSPLVARRLTLAGMRPISNVVDASNYVMLELGQPTHPYDLDKLPGRGLSVRRAEPGEVLVTLDGVERRLTADDCLICDAEGTPVGIGGVMGGASSEISDTTSTVLLEAAYFDPMAIAWTSKRLNLRTEASARFERGCDPEGIDRAAGRFLELLGGGEVAAGMLDVRTEPAAPSPIRLRTHRVNHILGTELGDAEVRALLEPIGFRVEPAGDGVQAVTPPSYRPDAGTEIDLVEEVARHHGYSNVRRTVPVSPYVGHLTTYQRERRRLRDVLAGAGVSEAVSPPLLAPGDHERTGHAGELIEAVDPLAREESVLRATLLPSLLKAVGFNAARRNADVWLFEVGKVFRVPTGRRGPLPDERELLGVALAGEGGGAPAAKQVLDVVLDAFRREARIEAATAPGLHPTRTARVLLGFDVIGHVGEVDPEVAAAFGIEGRVGWIDLDLSGLLPTSHSYAQARPVPRHPSSDVDLAFVVDDAVPAAAVAGTVRRAAGPLLEDLRLFDVYRHERLGAGRRSLAYRLRLQAPDRTLTDADVAEVRTACIEAVAATHGGELRA
ncbi:MAG TPA: phenylalanine--tRNA ligase subunit beta [Acidimicrobiales bacterium]|nr:phenylalanine--tRNA ligase subunit beta [Acidimicrobiales bacterium]